MIGIREIKPTFIDRSRITSNVAGEPALVIVKKIIKEQWLRSGCKGRHRKGRLDWRSWRNTGNVVSSSGGMMCLRRSVTLISGIGKQENAAANQDKQQAKNDDKFAWFMLFMVFADHSGAYIPFVR